MIVTNSDKNSSTQNNKITSFHNIMKQISWNKSSLQLKIDLQNKQTLQLNWNGNYLQK